MTLHIRTCKFFCVIGDVFVGYCIDEWFSRQLSTIWIVFSNVMTLIFLYTDVCVCVCVHTHQHKWEVLESLPFRWWHFSLIANIDVDRDIKIVDTVIQIVDNCEYLGHNFKLGLHNQTTESKERKIGWAGQHSGNLGWFSTVKWRTASNGKCLIHVFWKY